MALVNTPTLRPHVTALKRNATRSVGILKRNQEIADAARVSLAAAREAAQKAAAAEQETGGTPGVAP